MTSKRFLVIFAALVLMCIAAMVTGVGDYHDQIAAYNSMLMQAASSIHGDSEPPMPSMMFVFQRFSVIYATVGWILAIAIGFDLISKEKETGTLRLLLARPVFRDSIINGKIIGSMAILVVTLTATFMLAIAVLMLQGVVPAGDDLVNIASFYIMTVLFSLVFLAMAITASVMAKNSTVAMLMLIGFVVFSTSVPAFASSVSSIILGPAPPATIPYTGNSNPGNSQIGSGSTYAADITTANGIRMVANPAYGTYKQSETMITGLLDIVSPTSDFTAISSALVQPVTIEIGQNGYGVRMSNGGLSSVKPEIISLLLIAILGFAVSYIKFMRMDVR